MSPSPRMAGFMSATATVRSYIHQYDKDANWVRTWGGLGDAPGKLKHAAWPVAGRSAGREPSLVVADRANARLQYFTLDGKLISFIHDV